MNENITNRIIQYLNIKSNYAIIITGEYGIGKTHFLKTVVFPEVEKVPVPYSETGDKQKCFKTVHLSLFGAKSIEDIQKTLFLEIYPLLKSKAAKITKGVLKGFGQFFNINIDDLMTDATIGTKQAGFENLLICIDDIDRKNSALDLTEVYGYVNDLVENHGAKVILIANEDILKKEHNDKGTDDYSILREKVIGVTIPFAPDINKAFEQIIEQSYKENAIDYYNFLKANQQEILGVIKQANNNLRNLLFFLEHFKIVFNVAGSYFKEHPEIENYTDKLKKQLLTFSLPISIEFKIGKLDEANIIIIKDLYSNNFQFNFDLFYDKKEDRKKTYKDEFLDKYFKDIQIQKTFYPSVFNYILGSDEFTKEKFGEDISFILKTNGKDIPDEQILLQELGYWACVDFSEEEYESKTNQLIQYLMDGNIPLDQYGTVFHFATRFNNVLGYDLDDLKDRFLASMQSNIDKFEAIPEIKLSLIPQDAEFRAYLVMINNECIRINKEIQNKNNQQYWLQKFEEFKNGHDHFIEEARLINSDTSLVPYFSYFPKDEASDFILNLNRVQIISFSYYIIHRYDQSSEHYLKADRPFLESLCSKAKAALEDPDIDKMFRTVLHILVNDLNKAISVLSSNP
jgi:hypothetical protein